MKPGEENRYASHHCVTIMAKWLALSSKKTFYYLSSHRYVIEVYLRTLAVVGSITVWLASSFTGLDSVVAVHTNSNIFSCLVKSNPVKLEISIQ